MKLPSGSFTITGNPGGTPIRKSLEDGAGVTVAARETGTARELCYHRASAAGVIFFAMNFAFGQVSDAVRSKSRGMQAP